ncbi:MAG: TolB family protein [Thermoleophilia bacterium]
MTRHGAVLAVLAAAVAAGIIAAVLLRGGDDGGGDRAGAPATATTPTPAGPPRSAAVPQPISLAVEGRLWALRAGQEPWPLQGSRGYLPVGWSPDGSYLLAERRTGPRALAAFPIGGNTAPRPVATGLDRAAWSPDGRWIAARSGGDIALMRVGGATRPVAPAPPGDGPVAAWSADSTRIAWATAGADTAIAIAGVDGGAPRRLPLPAGPAPTALAWSPDGSAIGVARSGGGVLVLPVGGGAPRHAPAGSAPAWSPDGTRLAPAGRCPCGLPGARPAVAWSADGSRILRVAERGDTLVSTTPDGGDPTVVVRVRGRAIQRPMWVPAPG